MPEDRPDIAALVLVVDDNPDTLSMVSTALEEAGMTVLVARDGQSAIDLAARVAPDVILMDAVMPGLSGFEACRRLKSPPTANPAPIIFMTGLTASEHIVEGLRAGGVDYLTKPVDIDELIARVGVHLINARRLISATRALDTFGFSLLAFDAANRLAWASPEGERLIRSSGQPPEGSPQFIEWLDQVRQLPLSRADPFDLGGLRFQYRGPNAEGQVMVSVGGAAGPADSDRLRSAFGLTVREAEVLLWLSRGKTNRDIGEILKLSARTVNKHLEQIFQKMGVDNRTAAAVLADRELQS